MGSLGEARIDVIDLSLPEPQIAAALRKACEEVGFFYLVNHGIDLQLLDKVFQQSKKFFDLPMEEKLKVAMNKSGRGYTSYKGETLDPKNSKQGDSKEGYYIGRDFAADDPEASKPLRGPCQWPNPELLPEWRAVMSDYWRKMRQLGLRMVPLLALSLDLPRDWFSKPGMFDDPISSLRLLHYSAVKSLPAEGLFGAGAHSDYGVLTFLALDHVPGLQICRDKDAAPQLWEDVPAIPGAFVVNLGDCLERWTNHRYRSTLHRVLNPGVERYSVPFFFEPDYDCVVECLPTCQSPDHPPKYPPVTVAEYLLGKYKATHAEFQEKAVPSPSP